MSQKQANILIYTTEYCPYCVRAKSLLSSKRVDFTEIDINLRPDKSSEMISKSGGVTSVPQIFIEDEHIGGCDELYALESRSKLDVKLFI